MLGKFCNRCIILHTFIASIFVVSTENVIELSVELDTNEEQKIIGNEQLNEAGAIQSNVAGDGINKDMNGAKKEDINNKPGTTEDGNYEHLNNRNLLEKQAKLKEKKQPLRKFKRVPEKKHEPGFDLTPEEMNKFKIWKGGVVPYYIDVVSFNDKELRNKIRNHLQMVNFATSLNFIELLQPPTNEDERWVFFMNRRGLLGCADHTVKNFTNQGVQQVVLGYDCMTTKGELAEAVMSIAGVPAQHNAPDRDKYIEINMDNIMPDKKYLFEKLKDSDWLFHDLNYDFDSITHYDIFKYSVNGRAAVQPKGDSIDLNPAKTFSPNDLLKIRMLYNYITRNSNLQSQNCERLFKPRNKFERFFPQTAFIKPRKKPSRYLGIAGGARGSNNDSLVLTNPNKGQNEKEQGNDDKKEKKMKSQELEHNEGEEKLNNGKNKGNNYNEEKEVQNERNKSNPALARHAIQRIIPRENALSMLSDYDFDIYK